MTADFSPDQKRYLEGFLAGAQALRSVQAGAAPIPAAGASGHEGPDKAHLEAQDKLTGAGGKLSDPEKWKRAEHPFDAYSRFQAQARAGAYPKPDDNFRWRFHGLFYVAPAQDSYMCRLRIPNGILTHWQFAGVADLAERYGGGYAHVTTRANLQIREIKAQGAPDLVEGLTSLGIVTKGSGADNIRNVTGHATAGIDPQELIDTRPHTRAWHHHILNDRSLYGLPRKFNVGYDGGGSIPTLEDTNDIGFQAVRLREGIEFEGEPVAPGIWYRLTLGGITGHKDLARDTGVILKPEEATAVADAVVRVFIEHGDRSNRTKARLKYVLDAWGFPKFVAAIEEKLGRKLVKIDAAGIEPRPPHDRFAHIGVRAQKQAGLNWIGVAMPVGKLTVAQMRVLAAVAQHCGDGDIRLTVWQNLLVSGVPDAKLADAIAHIEACGLSAKADSVRSGLVACTGNQGCKFALSDTKGHALEIAEHLDGRVEIDQPVNIHLTGCPNSCAQHYVGDIGLVGVKVEVSEEEQVEGYHVVVGGGFGAQSRIGRELFANIPATEVPILIERMLKAYLGSRVGDESFHAFTNRHDIEALKALFAGAAS
ncbi:NAD(P)H-dependent nitrite reductase catalytic subunit [Rhizobiales bacterium GAS188]|nr:NAD(P)H-dependent nitrite reductase catalytic subunit [Rhizobiales bacterium GAS188]